MLKYVQLGAASGCGLWGSAAKYEPALKHVNLLKIFSNVRANKMIADKIFFCILI